ncbi:MAG: hypothetical protein K2X27_12950 [Candidatus Obscuribacterales bacterium]|nr:hypothetical protein [Candidatus Obscuribacterales bacterium]
MNSNSVLASLIAACFIANANAALADDNLESEKATVIKERATALPRALAGVMAGLSIGIPVKIGKDIKKETCRLAGALHQDMGNEFGIMENVFVLGGAVPFGILGGTILGTIHGTERALSYGSQQPFSKESFSLKEPYQEPKER